MIYLPAATRQEMARTTATLRLWEAKEQAEMREDVERQRLDRQTRWLLKTDARLRLIYAVLGCVLSVAVFIKRLWEVLP